MKLFNYLTVCFLISLTNGADVLDTIIPMCAKFTSQDSPITLLCASVINQHEQDPRDDYYLRNFDIFHPEDAESIGTIHMQLDARFAKDGKAVSINKIEIFSDQNKRKGYGSIAVILALQAFDTCCSDFKYFAVRPCVNNTIDATNFYLNLGFIPFYKSTSEELKHSLLLFMRRDDFLARYPKPVLPAPLTSPQKPIKSTHESTS